MLEGSLTKVTAEGPSASTCPSALSAILPVLGASGIQESVESRLWSPDSSQECSGKEVRKKECVRNGGGGRVLYHKERRERLSLAGAQLPDHGCAVIRHLTPRLPCLPQPMSPNKLGRHEADFLRYSVPATGHVTNKGRQAGQSAEAQRILLQG